MAAFGVGAALALTTTGLPLNANGDREGGPFAWFSAYAVLGGLAVGGFSLLHGLAFLALKTDGDVRHRARQWFVRLLPVLLLPIAGWAVSLQLLSGEIWTVLAVAAAVVAAVVAWNFARRGAEGRAFCPWARSCCWAAPRFSAPHSPVVLPSTLNPDFNLTISNASSSDYTLGLMTIVACIGLPLVLAYQAWTYWVFRRRVSDAHIPEAHSFLPAIAAKALAPKD